MRRSVSTAVLLVALGLGMARLGAGTGSSSANAQLKPETTEVKIEFGGRTGGVSGLEMRDKNIQIRIRK